MNYNILLSHNITFEECVSFEEIIDGNDTHIFAKLKPSQRVCVYCGNKQTNIKEYKCKTIHSLPTGKNNTIIHLSIPRYVCPICSKTYTHNINHIASNSVSTILKKKLLDKFSTICTYKSIANEFDMSTANVINIFDEICPNLKAPFSEAICIDEFSNVRKDELKYACVLIDFYTHKIIDIIPSRRTPYLDDYFKKLPLNVRNKVKYVITDMYDGYISAAKKWFKNATIAIDPFHYMQYVTDAVQEMRRRFLNDDSKYFRDRNWMGTHWRLLTTNPKNYPDSKMVLKSGMSISYRDRVLRFVKQIPELHYAFLKLQNIYVEMERITYEKARSFFESTISSLMNSTSNEFVSCGKTWNHYKEYIINSFIKYKDRRLSNGPIEGTNKRVKELKNVMSGYRDRERFYKRIILIQNNKKG